MKITEIAFSCYPVTDMARARAFYEGVLGLTPTMVVGEPDGMQWTEYDIANGTLSIGSGAPNWAPSSSGCSVGLEETTSTTRSDTSADKPSPSTWSPSKHPSAAWPSSSIPTATPSASTSASRDTGEADRFRRSRRLTARPVGPKVPPMAKVEPFPFPNEVYPDDWFSRLGRDDLFAGDAPIELETSILEDPALDEPLLETLAPNPA